MDCRLVHVSACVSRMYVVAHTKIKRKGIVYTVKKNSLQQSSDANRFNLQHNLKILASPKTSASGFHCCNAQLMKPTCQV
jgi:hypothetical protein